ncbi:hypothetical protein [Paenibacillus sp. GCM10027626]|uniref:hypothetical protein n=1 Tax=Paenibacillus sp. GCM10027626 TaxID=3273411 RepID=UPI0036251644
MAKRKLVIALFLSIMIALPSTSMAALSSNEPFHIGIFNPPPPEGTNAQSYAEIAGMNVNFIVGGNSHYTYDVNGTALNLAAQNGLKILVADTKFGWVEPELHQTSGDSVITVSNTSAWGQTILSPDRGTEWGLNTIDLLIDKNSWPATTTLTVTLYDSPAKTTTLGAASLTGPGTINSEAVRFRLNAGIQANTEYYLELTSNGSENIGLTASSSDVYTEGQAYHNNAVVSAKDLWFKVLFSQSAFYNGAQPQPAALADVVNNYWNHPGLMGYNLYDEPSSALFTRLGDMVHSLKALDPNHMSLVNLLPSDAPMNMLGINENKDGSVLSATSPLGQSFRTRAHETRISTVQWYVPWDQMQSGEHITLTLWDSPAKTTNIASYTLTSPIAGNNNPQFMLDADVLPNTDYYMELTHNGGGDNYVGIYRSAEGVNWYNHSTAYTGGAAINADFWFTINQNIAAFTYEDYVYRWVYTSPDVLLFDYYPFLVNDEFSDEYYDNLEIIRRQALAGSIDFWTFVQSVGIDNWKRSPSQDDMRYNIYTNLAYGSKGLIYFTYSQPIYPGFDGSIINADGSQNPSYGWARDLNAEVLKLGPTLNRLTTESVYHTGTLPASTTALPSSYFWQPDDMDEPFIISSFKDDSDRTYIMVVNRDMDHSRTSSFTLSTKPGLVKEISKVTGAEEDTNYNSLTGALTASFAPGEGRLYAIDA